MSQRWLYFSALICLLAFAGCRRALPPSFSPGEELLNLTEGLDDEEEIALYKDLQSQVTAVLRKHSGTPDKPLLLGNSEPTQEEITHLKHGYQLYSKYCVQCHGVNGNGKGAVAQYMDPKPRDYTYGIFKFTSTPYGSKPRRSDLIQTVQRGVTGTSMPSFDRFSKEQLGAVVDYVLVLTYRGELERSLAMIAYDDEELPDEEGIEEVVNSILEPWQNSSNQLVMPATMMPPMTEESIKAGHQLFLKQACNKCHGVYGRGGSVGNVEVGSDAWGNKAAAADLSSGMLRGGGRPLDIYRRIHSGINGTPMPAFGKVFADDPDAIWQLVQFIAQTGNRRRLGLEPLSEADLPVGGEGTATPAASEEDEDKDETEAAAKEEKAESEKEKPEADKAEEKAEESETEDDSPSDDETKEEPADKAEADSETEETSDKKEKPAEKQAADVAA